MLNDYINLDYIEAKSPGELKEIIRSIHLQIRIITIYAIGSRHIAWIQTNGNLKKISKEKENAKSK